MPRRLLAPLVGLTAALSLSTLAPDLAAQAPPAAAQPAPPGPGAPPPAYPPPGPLSPRIAEPPPPPTERHSTAMMVTGIVLTAAGPLAMSLGALVIVGANSVQCGPCPMTGPCPPCKDESSERGGMGLVVAGAVALAVGIPLIVVGARRVPAQPEARATLVIGPGRLSLSLQRRF